MVRPRNSARRWSGGLLSFGTLLPCLMAKNRPPLSIMVKPWPKLVNSSEVRERRGFRGARPRKERSALGSDLGREILRQDEEGEVKDEPTEKPTEGGR